MSDYYETLEAVQNDYGRTLTMKLIDSDDDPMNLSTSGTVTITMRRENDSSNWVSGQSCTISDTTSGIVTYTIQSGDLSSGGTYKVQTSYRTSGREVTFRGLTLYVVEEYEPR
jgi:hypothetical protein